ncbi:uncharacterized protein [Halyomorpha halys]|uniref:uncharacterized protein isoform X2 n=1 Tax=Halyomorpha halys TaxID=286706 RepID=UPI0006D4F7CA|nr:cilia- and flagella-associated protein 20-like isoform X1 [Halyomorpha halys]
MVREGFVKRENDEILKNKVIDIMGDIKNVSITTPKNKGGSLGIQMHWLGVVFKTFGRRMLIGAQVLDSTLMKRLFRFDSGCLKCKVTSIFTILPLAITDDWNCLEVDLKKQLRRFYGTDFVEIIRVEVHGSCRLRRIYASYDSLADLQIPIDSRILQ